MRHFYATVITPITYVVLAYFVALGAFYLIMYLSAALEMRRYLREVRAERHGTILSSELAPTISMLVPAHNEEQSIKESIRALLTVAYPQLEIVVVDDGSTDETLSTLTSTFDLLPYIHSMTGGLPPNRSLPSIGPSDSPTSSSWRRTKVVRLMLSMLHSISRVASWSAPSTPTRFSIPTASGGSYGRLSAIARWWQRGPPSGWPTDAR